MAAVMECLLVVGRVACRGDIDMDLDIDAYEASGKRGGMMAL